MLYPNRLSKIDYTRWVDGQELYRSLKQRIIKLWWKLWWWKSKCRNLQFLPKVNFDHILTRRSNLPTTVLMITFVGNIKSFYYKTVWWVCGENCGGESQNAAICIFYRLSRKWVVTECPKLFYQKERFGDDGFNYQSCGQHQELFLEKSLVSLWWKLWWWKSKCRNLQFLPKVNFDHILTRRSNLPTTVLMITFVGNIKSFYYKTVWWVCGENCGGESQNAAICIFYRLYRKLVTTECPKHFNQKECFGDDGVYYPFCGQHQELFLRTKTFSLWLIGTELRLIEGQKHQKSVLGTLIIFDGWMAKNLFIYLKRNY